MLKHCVIAVLAICLSAATAGADTLYGSCKYKDGSKADGTVTISTSWNGKKGYPRKGEYVLDFGGKVGNRITVYVNGASYADIEVKGDTRLDVIVP